MGISLARLDDDPGIAMALPAPRIVAHRCEPPPRRPAEHGERSRGVGDAARYVPGAARLQAPPNRLAARPLEGSDRLEHRIAARRSQVEDGHAGLAAKMRYRRG